MTNRRTVTTYTDEFKADILAEYAAGASAFSISRKHGITSVTIEMWAKQAGLSRGAAMSDGAKFEIQALVFEYLKANLQGLIAGAEILQDKEWLKAQSAEGVALLTSTIHDKTVSLLANMQANARPDPNLLPENHPDYMHLDKPREPDVQEVDVDDEYFDDAT